MLAGTELCRQLERCGRDRRRCVTMPGAGGRNRHRGQSVVVGQQCGDLAGHPVGRHVVVVDQDASPGLDHRHRIQSLFAVAGSLSVAAALVAAVGLQSAAGAAKAPPAPKPAKPPGKATALPFDQFPPSASDDVVLRWDEATLAAIRATRPGPTVVARALGFGPVVNLDGRVVSRGFRQVAQINRLPTALGVRLIEHFGTLQALFGASTTDLQAVDGVGESRARVIRDGLVRLAESAYTERMA